MEMRCVRWQTRTGRVNPQLTRATIMCGECKYAFYCGHVTRWTGTGTPPYQHRVKSHTPGIPPPCYRDHLLQLSVARGVRQRRGQRSARCSSFSYLWMPARTQTVQVPAVGKGVRACTRHIPWGSKYTYSTAFPYNEPLWVAHPTWNVGSYKCWSAGCMTRPTRTMRECKNRHRAICRDLECARSHHSRSCGITRVQSHEIMWDRR